MKTLQARLLLSALAVLLPTGWAGAAQAPRERVCRADEGPKDSSFVAFRARLLEIVRKRDANGLLRIVAPDVGNGADGELGLATFKQLHEPEDPRSQVWRDLAAILNMGGQFLRPNLFCAPYTRCPGPPVSQASPDIVVILGDHVPAFAQQSRNSEVVAWLSCDVLPWGGDGLPPRPTVTAVPGWSQVVLDGRWVYVEDKYVRSPSDRYVEFAKVSGRWFLGALLAGD